MMYRAGQGPLRRARLGHERSAHARLIGPAVVFGLAWALLPDQPAYRTGLIIVGLARCIAMLLILDDLCCGDPEATAVLVALNSLFQVVAFALPGYFCASFRAGSGCRRSACTFRSARREDGSGSSPRWPSSGSTSPSPDAGSWCRPPSDGEGCTSRQRVVVLVGATTRSCEPAVRHLHR